MKKILVFLVLASAVACSSQGDDALTAERILRVENGVPELTAFSVPGAIGAVRGDSVPTSTLAARMEQFGVPSVSIAVIDDYGIDWTKAYGVLERGTDRPATTESVYEAASTTKLLGTVLALRLVDEGRLELDEDVNRRLRSWKVPDNDFTRDEEVTLRRLLTHQAGLNRPDGGFDEEDSVPTLLQVLNGERPALNDAAVVELVPGSQWQYSNFGYLAIQVLLQDIEDKSYQEIADAAVFKTAGMMASTLDHPLTGYFKANLALPHDPEGNPHDRPQHPEALAQGGLVTTPTDLARFAIELMDAFRGKSGRMLSQRAVEQMFTVQCELDANNLGGITGQGLGVFLVGEGDSQYFLYAGHNAPGATSLVIASPRTGKGAVIMTNGVAGLQLSLELLAAIAGVYHWPTVE